MKNSVMHTMPYAIFALLAILMAVGTANIVQKHPPSTSQEPPQSSSSRQLLLDDGTYFKTFDIEVSPQGIEPRDIVISHGDSIQLTIVARQSAISMEIPELRAYLELAQDVKTVFSMRAEQEGTFPIICKKPCSPEGKAIGTLTVLKR